MENVLQESPVLESLIGHKLTNSDITVYKDILPDYELVNNLTEDFKFVYQEKYDKIKNIPDILYILRKYNIKNYYDKLLDYEIWKLLKLECKPRIMHPFINCDIINRNKDFKKILKYLYSGHKKNMSVEDFIFCLELYKISPCKLDKNVCIKNAIKYNAFDVVEILTKQYEGNFGRENMAKYMHDLYIYAAQYGKLNIIEWAHKQGYKLDEDINSLATTYGHLEILEWTKKIGLKSNVNLCSLAANNNHFDILKWAYENGYKLDESACEGAAKNGNFEMLKWIKEKGCNWNSYVCSNAALSGNLEMLQWAIEQGCNAFDNIIPYAALGGHIHIIEWAKKNGFICNEYACQNAAKGGHLEVLKYLRKNDCEWNHFTCLLAASYGKLDVLKWAVENGCSYNPQLCMKTAKRFPEVTKWISGQK